MYMEIHFHINHALIFVYKCVYLLFIFLSVRIFYYSGFTFLPYIGWVLGTKESKKCDSIHFYTFYYPFFIIFQSPSSYHL